MQANKCINCNELPKLLTDSGIQEEDVHHPIQLSRLKCSCSESTWHPTGGGDFTALYNEWNTKNPAPEEQHGMPLFEHLPVVNK